MSGGPHVAVAGGGITGLAAARRLAALGARVTVLEAGERCGGWIRTEELAGGPVDLGPESVLARVPWALELLHEAGLADELVSPATGHAYVWARGALRPLPQGIMSGAPGVGRAVATSGLLSPRGLARAALDLVLPGGAVVGDESVAHAVGSRLGGEAVSELVAPLLGGVYAGDVHALSVAAALPQVHAARRRGGSLLRALAASAPPPSDAPVFVTHPLGLGHVVDVLAAPTDAIALQNGARVRALRGAGSAVELELEGGATLQADGAILALPAAAAADALVGACPAAAAGLRTIPSASVAVTTLAYAAGDLPPLPHGSGLLVPPGTGMAVTAVTFSSQKWAHLARPRTVLLRASVGRAGEDTARSLGDDELLGRVRADLRRLLAIEAVPAEVRIVRFPDGLPQYTVGHLERVGRIEAAVHEALPGVTLAGAALRGIGIAACARQGREAAERVMESLVSPDERQLT